MKVGERDSIFLTEDEDGLRIMRLDPEFGRTMESASGVMKRRRNALRDLAK